MLTALPSQLWDYGKAAHLLNRAAFGGTPEQIAAVQKGGMQAAIRDLVDYPVDAAVGTAPPDWAQPRDMRQVRQEMQSLKADPVAFKEAQKKRQREQGQDVLDLRRWWLDRMMTSRAPLLEKMTLFWHGHFATSEQKVKNAYLMWLQNDTLRRNALGNFTTMVKTISRDPAMMIYLDLEQSRREHPNENWARELMELFTLGIGNYTEQDIKESARAFTGYRVNPATQGFRFAEFQHDETPKTFMGKTGPWNGDDIIEIILKQPACAQFIARKIWRYFVEDDPSPQVVETVAARLRQNNFEVKPILHEIFGSAEFYAPKVMRAQIKSPVQFLVQTSKLLETDLPPVNIAQNAMRQMGQVLFAPPNVKGWDGGKAWVSTSTLLFRYNFANYLINGDGRRPMLAEQKAKGLDPGFRVGNNNPAFNAHREPVDLAKLMPAELRDKPPELVANLAARLFQSPLTPKQTQTFVDYLAARQPDVSDNVLRGLLHLMMSTPQFQLT